MGSKNGQCLRVFKGHSGEVTSVAISSDGKHVLSASNDYTLLLWDMKSGKSLRTFSEHTGYIGHVAFTPDDKHALSIFSNNVLCLWDLNSGQCLHTFDISGCCVAITPDGKYALIGERNGKLSLYDLEKRKRALLDGFKGTQTWISSYGLPGILLGGTPILSMMWQSRQMANSPFPHLWITHCDYGI